MSAAKKAGKAKVKVKVEQEELRRLMKEQQRKSSDKSRVESPHARYNALGHLTCALCATPVKSDRLWATHVLGRQHKDRLAQLKAGNTVPEQPRILPVKRKAEEPHSEDGKRGKSSENAAESSGGLNLLAGVYEEEEEEAEGDGEEGGASDLPPGPQEQEVGGLPADFFDSSVPSTVPSTVPSSSTSSGPSPASHSGSVLKAAPGAPDRSPERKENTTEALPEGFFDDPVRDAKVRNVEAPQDHMDREWEEFQKEMRQVSSKSEAMMAEEDEEGRLERQIHEIDQQMECYRWVEQLRDRRDATRTGTRATDRMERTTELEEEGEEEEEEDEEQLLGLLSQDWRAKGALA